jgi:hypothetical protein
MILHSERLQPFVFGFHIIPAQLQIINSIAPVLFLPLIRTFLLPIFFKESIDNIALKINKMAFGVLFMVIGYMAAVVIELCLESGLKVNATWDLFPWIFVSTAEVITYLYLLEVFSSYVSSHHRVVTTVMFAMSQLLSGLILSAISKAYGNIDSIYFTMMVCSSIISMFFLKFAAKLTILKK